MCGPPRHLALASAVAALFGCSSSPNGGKPDGAPAASPSCPSVDAYCASPSRKCVRDWATAQLATAWCTDDAGAAPYDSVNLRPDCSGFDFVFTTGTDTGVVYIYEAGSGALVGIASEGPRDGCIAGDVTALPLGQSCYMRQRHLCGSIGATPMPNG
jgi:hypothetical protein